MIKRNIHASEYSITILEQACAIFCIVHHLLLFCYQFVEKTPKNMNDLIGFQGYHWMSESIAWQSLDLLNTCLDGQIMINKRKKRMIDNGIEMFETQLSLLGY